MSSALDSFDEAVASIPADQQPTQALSPLAMFDAASAAIPKPTPPAQPSSVWDRIGTGVTDMGFKAAQLMAHVLPEGAASALNTLNKKLSSATGTQYLPVSGVDAAINQREQQYEAQRAAAGSTGFDWARLAGNVINPANYVIPGGASTTLGRIGVGALQGGISNVLSSPTTGQDQGNFWTTQAKLGAGGALFGGALTAGAEAVSPWVNSGASKIKSLLTPTGQPSSAATAATEAAFKSAGVDPSSVSPDVLASFKAQVQQSLEAGKAPDPVTAANMARASSLPVPVPLLRGQAARDPMQFAAEQNLRGIQGVGEPITATLQAQNRALIDNIDTMGAKNAPNIVDAGQTAIGTLQHIDAQARKAVSGAYDAFKQSTGKTLDVPLQGVAQDYARVMNEYGASNVPEGVRNQLNGLGLLNGKQTKIFSIDDAENLLKVINKNYDPSNKVSASALDEIRRSVQGAITNGAGSDASGAEAAQLAQQARKMAAARFNMIDNVPAYKAAISDVAPDKFIQKYFWNGNAGEIANLKGLLGGADPAALSTVKSAILGDVKQRTLNGASPENGIFSQAQFNGLVRNQNNQKRFGALFEPHEVNGLENLGAVAETAMLPPKASAVNTSNTAGAAANLIQGAAKGGLGTKALSMLGKAQIPIASPVAAGAANKSSSAALRDLVRQSTQPLSAPNIDALNILTKRSGTVGGLLAGQVQNGTP
jgi:hypothetical protein